MEAAWQALLVEIDKGLELFGTSLAALPDAPANGPMLDPAIRDLVLRLGQLSVTSPRHFAVLRPLILASLPSAPQAIQDLLHAQLGDDDGSGHDGIVRRLVANDDLELLKCVAGSVPQRTEAMIRHAIDAEFLADMAGQGRPHASFVGAVALAAIGQPPAACLQPTEDPPDGSAADAAVARIIAARNARMSALPAPLPGQARLRVALCVSGQLRGWQRALATWAPLLQTEHEVHVFVHTWHSVGRKLPHVSHYHRSFQGRFLEELERVVALSGRDLVARDYPALIDWFASGDTIDAALLRDAYQTPHIVLQDDSAPPFAGMSNSEKMYTKVEASFDLARSTGIAFDVIARMRPDKALYPSPDFNWARALNVAQSNAAILADYAPVLHPHGGFVMADQFACGAADAMEAYSRTASFTRAAWETGLHGFPKAFVPHSNFAYTCLMNGLRIMGTPDLLFGPLHDPDHIPPQTLVALLRQDIAQRPETAFDARLLTAAEIDANEAAAC